MKKRTQFIRISAFAGVSLIISLVMAGVCLAGGIITVHGNSGSIEYMDRFSNTDRYKFGWGLDIEQKPGSFNWIHYSIPTIPFTKTRFLLVHYETGIPGETADSKIINLHVYDGKDVIYSNDSVSLTGGPAYTIIDMGSDKTINWGLGLSICSIAGVESMSHRLRIYAVWAEWH